MTYIDENNCIHYVCGFAMCLPTLQNKLKNTEMVLIRKIKGPAGMAGKLNGVGGKLDVGETPHEAQSREFLEETGVLVKPDRWLLFRVEKFTPEHTGQKLGAVVFFFSAELTLEEVKSVKTTTDETVLLIAQNLMHEVKDPMQSNLSYLIPMARAILDGLIEQIKH